MTGEVVRHLHGDHLGSKRLITDESGNIFYSSNYQSYGVSSGESGSEEYRYTGKPEDDASGLYYYGARFYDPSIGRFITADTKLGRLTDPLSLNRYIYCRDNPMKYTDPDGKIPVHILLGAALGAGWNVLEYMITHEGKEIDFKELLVTATSGAIEGGISFGVGGLGTSFLGKIIAATAGDALSASVSTAFEYVANSLTETEDYDYYTSAVDNLIVEPTMSFTASTSLNIVVELLPVKKPVKETIQDAIDYASYLISKVTTIPPSTTTVGTSTPTNYYDTSYDDIERMRLQRVP